MNGTGHRFLDCGDGRRLEELGGVVVSRPAPAAGFAPGLNESAWREAALSFVRDRDAGGEWSGAAPDDWRVNIDGAAMALRPAAAGQIGVFPEHAAVATGLLERAAALFPGGTFSALNLFAHTGLLTLRLAGAGGDVAHVDAQQAAVRQARGNAALSGLGDAKIRWLVDDAQTFMARELRRERKYSVIAADPPSFGRAGRGRREWKFDRDLPALLDAALALFAPGAALFCLTCHSVGWTAGRLGATAAAAFPGWSVETETLSLPSAVGGNTLPAGIAVYARRNPS